MEHQGRGQCRQLRPQELIGSKQAFTGVPTDVAGNRQQQDT